jgi:hypothetical protein
VAVPLALDSARRRLRRARASARLVSARRRCSGVSEEGGEEEEEGREAFDGAGAPARRRLAGRVKKSAMVLGAVGVGAGGDGGIGAPGLERFREAAEGRPGESVRSATAASLGILLGGSHSH